MKQILTNIQKEMRGLKLMAAFSSICEAEQIASRATVYKAVDPETFDGKSLKHRAVIRRAIKFLQTQGSFSDWDIDSICPDLPTAFAA